MNFPVHFLIPIMTNPSVHTQIFSGFLHASKLRPTSQRDASSEEHLYATSTTSLSAEKDLWLFYDGGGWAPTSHPQDILHFVWAPPLRFRDLEYSMIAGATSATSLKTLL